MNGTTREENIQRLDELLEGFKVAMLTTIHSENGSLHSRPMLTQQQPFDGSLWFFSRADSTNVEEIRSGAAVNLAYSLPDQGRFISITGTAYVIRDRIRMEALWDDAYLAWFPRGLEDPNLVLLRVDTTEAEIWDSAHQMTGLSIRLA